MIPPPFFPFFLLDTSLLLLLVSHMPLCLCHFPLGGVSRCLLYSSYTNWGQRMCRLSLDCCLPLCLRILLPPLSPDTQFLPSFTHTHTHAHSLQAQSGVHALPRSLTTSNTPQEWALTQLREFWHQRTPDYSSISECHPTTTECAAFSSTPRLNPLLRVSFLRSHDHVCNDEFGYQTGKDG